MNTERLVFCFAPNKPQNFKWMQALATAILISDILLNERKGFIDFLTISANHKLGLPLDSNNSSVGHFLTTLYSKERPASHFGGHFFLTNLNWQRFQRLVVYAPVRFEYFVFTTDDHVLVESNINALSGYIGDHLVWQSAMRIASFKLHSWET